MNTNNISALALAYIGDAIFELFVRHKVITATPMSVNMLHKTAASYVNADTQSKMYHALSAIATDEELAVLKRGRNAKSFTKPKNKNVSSYRHATGVEALFGYLYLNGDTIRLEYLFEVCANCVNGSEATGQNGEHNKGG